MDFLTLSRDRYSVRKLSDAPVEQEKIDLILKTAMEAPTACNNQPFKVWVIRSPEAVEKVYGTTTCTFGAKLFFVVGGDPKAAWVRPFDKKGFADVDASIVATHMMLAIHELGLGTTWVGFFDEDKLKAAFPEMADYELIAMFPTGYPAADAEPGKGHLSCKDKNDLIVEL